MTTVSVVHYVGATAKSRSVVASLVADQRDSGASVAVVDISRWTTISQELPPRWLATLLGHRVFSRNFAETIHGLGASIVTPNEPLDRPSNVREDHRAAIEIAIESELLTYYRVATLVDTPGVRKLRDRLRSATISTYWALDAEWSTNPPDSVCIPNGRTSRQKAARAVAEHHGIPVTLYENGRALPDSYYAGSTQPHDRVASQEEVDAVLAHLSRDDIVSLAQRWLSLRMSPTGGTNTFSHLWAQGTPRDTSHETTAVFFASSFDEFLAFGPMWTIDSWAHQFEAFDTMMSILEKSGVRLELRLHPNLATKSRRYFLQEVSDIRELMARHPGLTVHWHNADVNSYDLVKSADYVIVERSTIGLEASMLGKPVWVTQASQWDKTADIRQVLGPDQISSSTMDMWTADPYPAQRFAAYWMVQEHPLRYAWNSWSSWNPDKPPLRMRAALLAVKNPWNHKLQLVRLEWAKWRNSGFRAP